MYQYLKSYCPRIFAVVLLLAATNGCNNNGTYRISGTVVFDGKPVPKGKIYFIPDSSKGNEGVTGYANIINGKFDTSSEGGAGFIGGPTIIAIEGFDPDAPPDAPKPGEESTEATIKVLFARYEIAEDLPKESISDKKFDVPASASKGPTKKVDPNFVNP
ncbi:MAG: hypothetical protein R3B84_22040 [Zavarzinella sp.]